MSFWFAAVFDLFLALVIGLYVRRSIRSRAAVGLWWDFLRDQEPKRFWLQILLVAAAGLDCLWGAVNIIVKGLSS